MVGRTPEYLGKKIGPFEMKMAVLVILAPPLATLVGTAINVLADPSVAGVQDGGPHGFSEILYAFSSQGNNNGSAFAGYGANNVVTNVVGGLAMIVARYWVAIPTLAIAGALAAKQSVPASLGTMPTHTPLFVGLLIGTVLLVGALTFIPALALGPIVEHLLLNAGQTF
jgi:K+-transporting ATPase ATPase A chain